MKYAQIRKYDVTNGPGVRATLFVSGCRFNCEGCFNKEQQSFDYGNEFTKEIEDSFIEAIKNPSVVGVSLLGGEIMQQDTDTILNLVKRIKYETGKPIWCWTGYVYEDLIRISGKIDILEYIDVLIDGRFEIDKRDLMLKYRGSSNQRVINVTETLKSREVVLYNIQ